MKLEEARRTDQRGHMLFHQASLAALFFLHAPADPKFPTVAVVDPLQREKLLAIARASGRFPEEQIRAWAEDYLLEYGPNLEVDGFRDIELKREEAAATIDRRLRQGGHPFDKTRIHYLYTIDQAKESFGYALGKLLESFGLVFESGSFTDRAVEAIYEAAQA